MKHLGPLLVIIFMCSYVAAQANATRTFSGKVELNLAVDNLFNKHYFETQNYFESRLRPGDPVVSRIHGTPGYPIGLTIGLTFRLSGQ